MIPRLISGFVAAVALSGGFAACSVSGSAVQGMEGPNSAEGPMVDLHRYVDHEHMRPRWKELQMNYLGNKLLVVHSSSIGNGTIAKMNVVADEESTQCRISVHRSNRYGVRGTILFKHGSVEPIGYTGAGACAAEPAVGNQPEAPQVGRDRCLFNEGASISLHGLAWRGERETEKGAKSLSRRRAEYVQEHLDGTALPQEVTGVEAHGTDRTDVELPTDGPVPGVYLAIKNPGVADSDEPFRFHNRTGPPIPEDTLEKLASFMAAVASRSELHAFPSQDTSMSIWYRSPDGRAIEYSGNPLSEDRRAMAAVYRWAHALTKANCSYDSVKPIKFFIQ